MHRALNALDQRAAIVSVAFGLIASGTTYWLTYALTADGIATGWSLPVPPSVFCSLLGVGTAIATYKLEKS